MHTPGLRRSLTLTDLIAYGLLFIGPLAPVGVFGVMDARADGAVAAVYLVATIAMAFTAWSYAQMSAVIPHAGSVYAYAREGLAPSIGFLAGWLAMLDYLLIPSVAYLFSGIALHALVPAVPAWVFTAAAFAVTTILNLEGVRLAARVGTAVLMAEIAVLGLFVVVATALIVQGGAARPLASPFTGVSVFDFSAVGGAVSIAVLSFLGFDAIASFAEESAGDRRQVGTAIVICLAIAGGAFVLQVFLAAVLSPIGPQQLVAEPARQGTAFYDLSRLAIGGWMATLLAVTKAVGPAFAAMTAQAASARLLFGMSRDGRLPAVLARIDPRRQVPTAALLTSGGLTLVVSVWAAWRADGLDLLVSIVDVGALTAFVLLHASVIGYFVLRRRAPARPAHFIVPVLGGLVTAWVIVEASAAAKWVAIAWLVPGLAMLGMRRERR